MDAHKKLHSLLPITYSDERVVFDIDTRDDMKQSHIAITEFQKTSPLSCFEDTLYVVVAYSYLNIIQPISI